MKHTYFYSNSEEANIYLNKLRTQYAIVQMINPEFTEQGLYTFIID